jgi:ribonuclease PH
VAAVLAVRQLQEQGKLKGSPIRQLVSAVSVGVYQDEVVLDLNYEEDKAVSVDFNLVVTEAGQYVEVQGSGEEAVFSPEQLARMLDLGRNGASELVEAQRSALGWGAEGEAGSKNA